MRSRRLKFQYYLQPVEFFVCNKVSPRTNRTPTLTSVPCAPAIRDTCRAPNKKTNWTAKIFPDIDKIGRIAYLAHWADNLHKVENLCHTYNVHACSNSMWTSQKSHCPLTRPPPHTRENTIATTIDTTRYYYYYFYYYWYFYWYYY